MIVSKVGGATDMEHENVFDFSQYSVSRYLKYHCKETRRKLNVLTMYLAAERHFERVANFLMAITVVNYTSFPFKTLESALSACY
jgi:phosphate uptake regulator